MRPLLMMAAMLAATLTAGLCGSASATNIANDFCQVQVQKVVQVQDVHHAPQVRVVRVQDHVVDRFFDQHGNEVTVFASGKRVVRARQVQVVRNVQVRRQRAARVEIVEVRNVRVRNNRGFRARNFGGGGGNVNVGLFQVNL